VANPRSGQDQPQVPKTQDAPHAHPIIEQRHRDRKAHPDRVDRTGALDEESLAARQRVQSEQAASPLASGLWHVGEPFDATVGDEQDRLHSRTLARPGDSLGLYPGSGLPI
jgi:hypothetical protein